MVYVFSQHKVKDYASWKVVFDSAVEMRRASGEKSWQIFHPDDDPNNIVVLFGWDNLENARAFLANPGLKEAMGKGGVLEPPTVYFLEEYEQGTT